MSEPEAVVAIITTRVRTTIVDLQNENRIDTYEPSRLRGKLKDGRPFIIATSASRLHGHRLLDYEVWHPHNSSDRESRDILEMKEIARARLRRSQ